MAEIALRTTERRSERAWRPVGSTIVCLSDSCIRRKWLEIFCDLASPKKREYYVSRTIPEWVSGPRRYPIPGFNRICEAWTPELRLAWLEYDRPTEAHKLGRLLMDNSYPQEFWAYLIEPIGVLADIPFAPESNVKAYDTWLWSEAERKRYFIIVNDDADDEEVESWQTAEMRDGDLGIVLPELSREPIVIPTVDFEASSWVKNTADTILFNGKYYKTDVFTHLEGDESLTVWGREVHDPTINVVSIWKKRFDYIADETISGATMDDIANPDKVLHPRFDKPISSTQMKQPKIADFKRIDL